MKKKVKKIAPYKKAPAMVSIYQYQFRLQAVDVVGINTKSAILPYLAMLVICFIFG